MEFPIQAIKDLIAILRAGKLLESRKEAMLAVASILTWAAGLMPDKPVFGDAVDAEQLADPLLADLLEEQLVKGEDPKEGIGTVILIKIAFAILKRVLFA